jgi:apolipoprotein N-acyltransferase
MYPHLFIQRTIIIGVIFFILQFAAGFNHFFIVACILALPAVYALSKTQEPALQETPLKTMLAHFLFLWGLSFIMALSATIIKENIFLYPYVKAPFSVIAVLVALNSSFWLSGFGFLLWNFTPAVKKLPASRRPFLLLVLGYIFTCVVSIIFLKIQNPIVFTMLNPKAFFSAEFYLGGALIISFPLFYFLFYLEEKFVHADREQKSRRIILVVSGILTAFAFPMADFPLLRGEPWIAWFSLTPLFFILMKQKSFKEALLSAYLWEASFTLTLLYWTKDFGEPAAFFLAIMMPLYRIIPLAVAIVSVRRLPLLLRPLYLASAYLMGDILRSYGYLAFPWGFLGYSQVPWPAVTMLSRYGGVWLVSLLPLLSNISLAILIFHWQESKKGISIRNTSHSIQDFASQVKEFFIFFKMSLFQKMGSRISQVSRFFILFIITLSVTFVYFHLKLPAPDPNLLHGKDVKKFIIVQPVFDPWASWSRNKQRYFRILEKWTLEGARNDIDFILWTESSTLESFALFEKKLMRDPFQENVKKLIRELAKPLLTGAVDNDEIIDPDGISFLHYNAATLFDQDASIVKSYRKNQLVPFGEWFPYDALLPGIRTILDKFGASQWSPGKELALMELPQMGKFGPLICYEGIFFRHVHKYITMGADYFINLTNLMWTSTYAGHMQHASIAQLRAMEQNRFFLRAANDGLSCVIDPYGRVIQSIPLYKAGFLYGKVDVASRPKTFYGEQGDWFMAILVIIFLLLTSLAFILNRKKVPVKVEI